MLTIKPAHAEAFKQDYGEGCGFPQSQTWTTEGMNTINENDDRKSRTG